MDIDAIKNAEWETELHRNLDAAVEAVRRWEPRATNDIIEPTVRQMAQAGVDSWRATAKATGAPRNREWEDALHRSLDAGVAAGRELDPVATDDVVVPLVRQVAQSALDSWRIPG